LCAVTIAGAVFLFGDSGPVVIVGVLGLAVLSALTLWLLRQNDAQIDRILAAHKEMASTLQSRDARLNQKAYQSAISKEISDRISSSPDVSETLEIIAGSLGAILDYSAVSYMVLEKNGTILFKCHLEIAVNAAFMESVKRAMLDALKLVHDASFKEEDIKTAHFGAMLDESAKEPMRSFFNVPMLVDGALVGMVNVASVKPDAYGEADAGILYGVVAQAGVMTTKIKHLIAEETNKVNAMLASISEGLIMIGHEEKVVIVNKRAKEILDIVKQDGEVLLLDVIQALYGKFDFRGFADQVLQSNKMEIFPELLLQKTFFKVIATPVRDRTGHTIGVVFVFSDITKEKEVDKMKSEFISITSHQLRTPLSSMKWFLEMLVNGDLGAMTEKQASVVLDIYNSNERIIMLVNDLLDVSRMESGKVVLEPTPTNLADFIKSMLPEVNQNFVKRKQTFEFVKPDTLPRIAIDPKLIWQALANLLTNASKYTPEGGKIKLRLALDAKNILIEVSDNGFGIPEFQKNRIFEKFFRADNTAKQEGTGLGLYIVKEIIEASGGIIWFESMEGKGTTFSFTLPLEGSKPNKIV